MIQFKNPFSYVIYITENIKQLCCSFFEINLIAALCSVLKIMTPKEMHKLYIITAHYSVSPEQ